MSGKWTTEALNVLNNLTKNLEDGKITYQRFPKEAARGWHQGGRANEIASILLGTNESSSTENPRSFSEKYERDKREQHIQERIIENWAKAEGIWHDNLDNVEGKEIVAEGGEAKVFHNGNEENVTKILSTRYFITPQFALDRITIHNTLFPAAPLRVIGFGRNIKTNKYRKAGTDAITLDSENHKIIYLIDHSADKELADNLKKGDGFGIRKTYNIETITKENVREIIRNISPSYEYSTERVLHALQTIGLTKEHLLGIDLNDEFKRAANSTDVLHGKNRGVWSKGGFGYDNSSSKQGRRVEGNLEQKASFQVTEDGAEFFLTPQGEVYGFVDKAGNIYLDETKISPEHPIHEYTLLWDRVVAQKNPELWHRGVELMKQTSLWNEILNDPNYGKKWQAIKGISQEKLDSLIASEVHARFTGEDGAQLLDKLAKEKGQSGIISKLKQWILDVWKDLKATFSSWSKEDLDNLTLKDFNHMTVRDFTEGINPLKVKELQKSEQPVANFSWATKSDNGYEVSTKGDERFSAFNTTFNPGTTMQGFDVSGMSIENYCCPVKLLQTK